MAMKDRMWVKTWKVVVNNSGHSNMSSVVGRYMTPEAAERVAQAFRDALHADPYNYRSKTQYNPLNQDVTIETSAEVAVTVEADGFNSTMDNDAIRLAQKHDIEVRDENGQPIDLYAQGEA